MPCSGIVDYVIPAGASFKQGDLMAKVTNVLLKTMNFQFKTMEFCIQNGGFWSRYGRSTAHLRRRSALRSTGMYCAGRMALRSRQERASVRA